MPKRIPKYSHHKPTGQARVRINGKSFYLGPYDSEQSRQRYDALIANYLTGTLDADRETLTIGRLAVLFMDHAAGYSVKDGQPTGEISRLQTAFRPLVQKYSRERVSRFGPLKLKDVRELMIRKGWTRSGINDAVKRIVRMLRWAVENELAAPAVYDACRAVTGLRCNRSAAREADPVTPVPLDDLNAVLPHLNRQVRAMVELQLVSGMRPGEVTRIRLTDIDRTGETWVYRPHRHKLQHHGKDRTVFLGPRAQEILQPFLTADRQRYLFSPADAEAERNAARRADRQSPMTPSQAARQRKNTPKRTAGTRYTTESFRRVIYRICRRHGIPVWSPNQLRHNAATDIRRQFGLDAARTVLGHAESNTTERYAEVDLDAARRVISAVG